MPDAAKWRRWTRLQTVAWIAFRDNRAVQVAADVEAGAEDDRPANLYSYLAVEGALHTVRLKGEELDRAGTAVADAIRQLEAADALVTNKSKRFCVAEIKKLFPSKEGQGKGQRPRNEIEYQKIVDLGFFFLTNRKDPTNPEHSWDGVFVRCIKEKLLKTRKQYEKLRPKAFKFAEKELDLRWRAGAGIVDHKQPLGHEEYEQYQANLKSWQRRGRPAKSA